MIFGGFPFNNVVRINGMGLIIGKITIGACPVFNGRIAEFNGILVDGDGPPLAKHDFNQHAVHGCLNREEP